MTEERRAQEQEDPAWEAIRDFRLLSNATSQAARQLLGKVLQRCQMSAGAFVLLRKPQPDPRVVIGADLPEIDEKSILHQAVQQQEFWLLEDAAADERTRNCSEVEGGPGLRFFASVPVKAPNGVPVALLVVFDRRPVDEIGGDIAGLLPSFASVFEQLFVRRAGQDLEADTGLLGRKAYAEQFSEEWRVLLQAEQRLDTLVFSLPGLGNINRRYGVEAGDAVVASLASAIQGKLLVDRLLFGRISGSSIGMLLPSRLSTEFVQSTVEGVRDGLRLQDGQPVEVAVALFQLWPSMHPEVESVAVLRAMERITARRKLCRYPQVPRFTADNIRELAAPAADKPAEAVDAAETDAASAAESARDMAGEGEEQTSVQA